MHVEDQIQVYITATSTALDTCESLRRGDVTAVLNKEDIARRHIFQDLEEALTLLKMAHRVVVQLRPISLRLSAALQVFTKKKNDPNHEVWTALSQQRELSAELVVLMKALYEWFYHVHDALRRTPALRKRVPAEVRARLERLGIFRGSLVAHKTELKLPSVAGLRFNANLTSFEFMATARAESHPELAAELGRLWDMAKPHLDAGAASEENIYERMGTLYAKLDTLPKQLHKRIKGFLEKYGTTSDSPVTLAACLAELSTALVPVLVHAKGTS